MMWLICEMVNLYLHQYFCKPDHLRIPVLAGIDGYQIDFDPSLAFDIAVYFITKPVIMYITFCM